MKFRPAAVVAVPSLLAATASAQNYDPAPGFYDNITGTGSSLVSQLETLMSTNHDQTTYGEVRFLLPSTDRDPNDSSKMLLVYTRESNNREWQAGNYDSREHIWPRSRLGSPSNAGNNTAGAFGDIHMLKPAEQGINSDRGNRSFGLDGTTGTARIVLGNYFYPGDADRGDVARIAFYGATRWRSDGLQLVNNTGNTSQEQMGDLDSLLRWHYEDTPDDFERRRNDIIGDAITNTRNAYIDRPEYVWSAYVDQQNDSQLTLAGGTGSTAGGTNATVAFAPRIVGNTTPLASTVTLQKAGNDGTYFEVTTTGDATSDVTGRYHAFTMGGPGSRQIQVGLPANVANTPGVYGGTVRIDNLDVTTQGGAGRGSNDGDDIVDVSTTVLAASDASFAATGDLETLSLDLGIIGVNLGDATETASIFNIDAGNFGVGLVASLDLDDATFVSGDEDAFFVNAFGTGSGVAGESAGFVAANLDDAVVGDFAASFAIGTSDTDGILGGSAFGQGDSLTLNLVGEVRLGGDATGDGIVNLADFGVLRGNFGTNVSDYTLGDFDRNGVVNLADFGILRANFGQSASLAADVALMEAWVATVPEPVGLSLLALGGLLLRRRR